MAFFVVDAKIINQNTTRPAHVNVDNVAFVTSAGEVYDANGAAAIIFNGGLETPIQRLITLQTPAQVRTLIDAAIA